MLRDRPVSAVSDRIGRFRLCGAEAAGSSDRAPISPPVTARNTASARRGRGYFRVGVSGLGEPGTSSGFRRGFRPRSGKRCSNTLFDPNTGWPVRVKVINSVSFAPSFEQPGVAERGPLCGGEAAGPPEGADDFMGKGLLDVVLTVDAQQNDLPHAPVPRVEGRQLPAGGAAGIRPARRHFDQRCLALGAARPGPPRDPRAGHRSRRSPPPGTRPRRGAPPRLFPGRGLATPRGVAPARCQIRRRRLPARLEQKMQQPTLRPDQRFLPPRKDLALQIAGAIVRRAGDG